MGSIIKDIYLAYINMRGWLLFAMMGQSLWKYLDIFGNICGNVCNCFGYFLKMEMSEILFFRVTCLRLG